MSNSTARFETGDTYQHSDLDSPTVIVIRQSDGSWRRVGRKTGEEEVPARAGFLGSYARADDWVAYLVDHCGFVKVEE